MVGPGVTVRLWESHKACWRGWESWDRSSVHPARNPAIQSPPPSSITGQAPSSTHRRNDRRDEKPETEMGRTSRE